MADHGGDPGRLTVSGHSAGAHLATMLFNDRAYRQTSEARCSLVGCMS
ncbi:hypothetical protein [Mesorhizobium caraganae]